ncbi:hypothetical protein GCM10009839_79740 [Catenulispora yoronensis]|uniref:DUF4825 domain-containing protein n=1 Tax=Catenulispora yoronensis TaxID=450799 RepID=A0ABN2VC70_9ACTN
MNFSHSSARIQILAALVIGGIGVGAVVYWSNSSTTGTEVKPCKPASQSAVDVSASTLCTALQKADLPTLLGIPKAPSEFGGAMSQPVEGGDPSVRVLYAVGPYSVILSTHKPGKVKETEKVAGHPAALVTGTAGGRQLYNLAVDYDSAGTGYYALDVMMTDGTPITQDTAGKLERAVAEKVLPTLPEWRS